MLVFKFNEIDQGHVHKRHVLTFPFCFSVYALTTSYRFVVLGKYLEAMAKARTSNSLTSLMSIKVERATLLKPRSKSDEMDTISKINTPSNLQSMSSAVSSADEAEIQPLTEGLDVVGSNIGEIFGQEVEIDPKLLQPGDFVKV